MPASLAAALVVLAVPTGGGAVPAAARVAVVPTNDLAVIYDTFPRVNTPGTPIGPLFAAEADFLGRLAGNLARDGYRVRTVYQPTRGADFSPTGLGTDNPANFLGLAKAGVAVINTHGVDLTKPSTCRGKGVIRVKFTDEPAAPSEPVQPIAPALHVICTQREFEERFVRPHLLLAVFPNRPRALASYHRAVSLGIDPEDLALVLEPHGNNADWPVPVYDLFISRDGIARAFSDRKLALVDGYACHSLSFASAFRALSYWGYVISACSSDIDDQVSFWNRLLGLNGVAARTTVAADRLDHFRGKPMLATGSEPVVLSPAVESVSPANGAKIRSGRSTDVHVRFDAQMVPKGAATLIKASGCGATVSGGSWSDQSSELGFELETKSASADTPITLTIRSAAAVAPGEGKQTRLDGNQRPKGTSGKAPNGDNYVWHLTCTGTRRTPSPTPTPTQPSGGPQTPVTVTFSGKWSIDEHALTKEVDQVHGVETASGTWKYVWKLHESDFVPAPGNATKSFTAVTAAAAGTASQTNTNPDSTCKQTENGPGNTTLTFYPAGSGRWVAAVHLPPQPDFGLGIPFEPWKIVSGCNGSGPGVGFDSPGASGPNGALGQAVYTPAVSVPTKYMPGGGQNLQVEHWMYAVFPVKQNGPAARIPLSFSYSYPYNSKTLGDGTVAWSGTVTIIVGG